MVNLNPVLTQQGSYPMSGFERLKAELRAQGRPVYDFGIGDPVEETPPFIRTALVEALTPRSQYPTALGQQRLREAAAGYLQRRFGVALDPNRHVLPTSGSKEAIFQLPLAVIDRGSPKRLVVMPDPGYPVYGHGTELAGGVSVKVPLRAENGFLLEPEELPDAVLRQIAIFWISYPHNPTGAVAPLAYYQRVFQLAERYDFLVASDECYADLGFTDVAVPSALQVSVRRTVVFHSCSKRSGMTGYRSGFMAGDPDLMASLRGLRASTGTASADFVQHAAAAAWADDAHARERHGIFAAKRTRLLAFLEKKGLEAQWSQGTFYLWIRVPPAFSSTSYAEALLKEGIVVSPGPMFGAGEGFIRVALVPSLSELEQAITAWARVG